MRCLPAPRCAESRAAQRARPIPSTCAHAATSRNGQRRGRARRGRRSASRVDTRRVDAARRQHRRCASSSDFTGAVEGKRRSQAVFVGTCVAARAAARGDACCANRSLQRLRHDDFAESRPALAAAVMDGLARLGRARLSRAVARRAVRAAGVGARADAVARSAALSGHRRVDGLQRRDDGRLRRQPDLQPMRTTQRTLGIVLQPARNATVALDLWNVRSVDYISSQSLPVVLSGNPASKAR